MDVEYGDMSNIDPSSTKATVGAFATFRTYVENNIFYINATPQAGVTGTGITFNIFGQCFKIKNINGWNCYQLN